MNKNELVVLAKHLVQFAAETQSEGEASVVGGCIAIVMKAVGMAREEGDDVEFAVMVRPKKDHAARWLFNEGPDDECEVEEEAEG